MSAEPLPLLAPASRAELRAWLAENHATSPGVELAVGKKGNAVTALTYDDVVDGLMTPAGLAVVEAAQADGSRTLLNDAEDLVIPPDLAAALSAAGASDRFSALPARQQSEALYRIGSAKRTETCARRIVETIAAALEGLDPV